MVSELTMANITQSNASFSFITPVKLDQNNFILWRTQILTSIKGNVSKVSLMVIENVQRSFFHSSTLKKLQDQMLVSPDL
ncbi:hypothetical protein AB3S75_040990 [Citrus x aurantiifolia]